MREEKANSKLLLLEIGNFVGFPVEFFFFFFGVGGVGVGRLLGR